jgi:NhaP-type Na+/H+ or K+/H+ antiporter
LGNTEHVLIALTWIAVVGIGMQWLAWGTRLPSILLLLAAGFVLGPAAGVLDPDTIFGDLLLPAVSISVALILFEGALGLRLREVKASMGSIVSLVTVGAFVTWLMAAAGARLLLGFDIPMALLLGAILVVTGPTVIGPILLQVRPTGPVGRISKWEGIVIDPIGAVLAVLVFEGLHAVQLAGMEKAALGVAGDLLQTVGVGVGLSFFAAVPLVWLMRRFLIPDFLESPILVAVVVAVFTLSNVVQPESGLLTVTVLGVILANQKWVEIRRLIEFKENLRVLLISSLFIILAARLKVDDVLALGWSSIAFVAFLILIVRPAAVWLSTMRSGLKWQEKAFLAWLAPRGIVAAAVASVFALHAEEVGSELVAATFAVIIGTVTVYGLSIGPFAQRLGLATPNPQGIVILSAHPGARAIGLKVKEAGIRVLMVDSNADHIRVARMEGLPVWLGSILSHQAIDEMDLGGIGRFLALTPNREVNSLAGQHFSEVFGRESVYLLPSPPPKGIRGETAAKFVHGRIAFGREITFDYLQDRFARGAEVKKTRLTAEFDFEDLQAYYHGMAVPLFLVSETGKFTVFTAVDPPQPKVGQTVIVLVDPVAENSDGAK